MVNVGSYPETGWLPNVVGSPVNRSEFVDGRGPSVWYTEYIDGYPDDGRGIVILPDPERIDYSQRLEMSWHKAKVAFGHPEVASPEDWLGLGNQAPAGPSHNKGWNKVGEVSGLFGYAEYTHRPGGLGKPADQ